MVNFSSNNQAYVRSETTAKTNVQNKNKFTTKHKFQCRHTKRIYTYFEHTDKEGEITQFTVGEVYVLRGFVNTQGYANFLVLKSWCIDDKSKETAFDKLYNSVPKAENSISTLQDDNS